MNDQNHIPVLLDESVSSLNLKQGDSAIDATLGEGGHTRKLLDCIGDKGTVLAIDQDPRMVHRAKEEFSSENIIIAENNFRNIETLAKENNLIPKGILFDLGVARWHFLGSGRGFSFKNSHEPLSMALSGEHSNSSAAMLLNSLSEEELADIIFQYGEERRSRMIAKSIVAFRKKKRILTVGDLLAALPHGRSGQIHPATKVFQALRIAVNDELNALSEALVGAWSVLAPRGRLAVISYHSLEDRIVKQFFKKQMDAKTGILINKKPIVASRVELLKNPSARSAKLRVIEKI